MNLQAWTWREGFRYKEARTPTLTLCANSRVAFSLHSTLKFKSGHSGTFWKGAKMNSGGGGRYGKSRWIIFFPLLTNEEHPRPPLLMDPPQVRMRSWAAGGYLRRGYRGCGSAPNSGLRETSGPRIRQHSLSTTNPPPLEPWRQWRQPRLNCSSSAGTFSACCCR